jgi:hypothetical protein
MQHADVCLINHRLERVQWLRTTPFPSFPQSALSLLPSLLLSSNPGHRVMHPGRATVYPPSLPPPARSHPIPSPIVYTRPTLRIQDPQQPMHRVPHHTRAPKALRTPYHISATTSQPTLFHMPHHSHIILHSPTHKTRDLLAEMPVHKPETSAIPTVRLPSTDSPPPEFQPALFDLFSPLDKRLRQWPWTPLARPS